MYPIIRMRGRKGFTLVEIMVATFITLYTLMAAWSSYIMFWTWWHETSPEVEAQRMARITISAIVNGKIDPTAGTYTIGTTTFHRRNGIAQATMEPSFPSTQAINFGLEPDTANVRSYYLGVDPETNHNVVYYKDSTSTVSKIDSTIGITDLTFTNVFNGSITTNMITVTVTVDRDVIDMGGRTRTIHVVYSQLVFLRNVS
ncbi:MAG: prepilin-type N-terminal cleavage/methylation domain-containing protein [Candidatus Omnitrophota bacterium]